MLTGPIRYASETLFALKQRIGHYIQLAACFTDDWGIFDEDGTPRLFRYDVRRLTSMVVRAEHFLRCAIILTVFERLRHGGITPRPFGLNGAPVRSSRTPETPLHPFAALRGIQKRDPAPPGFSVSMPSEAGPAASTPSLKGTRTSHRRARNDDILACDILMARIERLKTIRAEIDDRADKLAAIWAGMISSRKTPSRATSEITRPANLFLPLKDWRPPPETTQGAPPDETEDLITLHWAAYNAAEGIAALCGRMR
ncbi:MAG TPA: hypothetical protein DDZ43_10565 [Hyphomonadaceae bacterium]|nr:hypothetical protein [Hyphomonadaceae bacterium]HBJ93309.1 hypothetical protein [Hyphomonadaceae bacterium]|tara:strand:- start:883 stop:1650 length:768 start_codon:yes stop_codon:yes gene_type:complete